MSQAPLPESILMVDCGAVATKVGLVDRVGSEYRLIGMTRAATTVEPPVADISVGVKRAVAQLESLIGRTLLTDRGELMTPEQESGAGVDTCVAVTSAALPLRGAIIGLSRDLSVASAQRALSRTSVVVETTIAVDEESGRWGTTARDGRAGGPSAAVENLAASRPDVIVMAGGVDGGAVTPLLEMANIIASIGAAMGEGMRPLVVYAGNRQARGQVAERIGGLMEVRAVDNVRPQLDLENLAPLQSELEAIFYELRVKQIPGLVKLSTWAARPVLPTLSAYEKVAQFLSKRYGLRVLALDLGGAALAQIRTDGTQSARMMLPDTGLGYGLDRLIARVGIESVARWLPNSLDLEQAHAFLLNQSLRPWTTPTLAEDRVALNAAAREAVALVSANEQNANAEDVDLVLIGGAPVARGSTPNALMLLALDALNLRGVFSVAMDASGLAPACGALAQVNPEAAAQVVERDSLVTLGTALVPIYGGTPPDGSVMQVRIATSTGGQLEVQVEAGGLELIPLGVGDKANVEIRPASGVDLRMPLKNGVFQREMEGGTVGLVVDARGRPLPISDNLEEQRDRAQKWLWEVGA